MRNPYRVSQRPSEEPPKKRPLLCRIGLHFWGGWALDGCGVFWCTRCDRYFVAHVDKEPLETPSVLFAREEITVEGWRCDVYTMASPCERPAKFAVKHENDIVFFCSSCAENLAADEGPDVDIRPLSQFYNQVFER